MALHLQTFKTRTLTAIVFAAVMLAGLLINHWTFLILFSIIHFGCWWEYLNLMEKIHRTSIHRYSRLGFMLLGFGIMLWFCGAIYNINNYPLKNNFSFPVSVAGIFLLALGIFQTPKITLRSIGASALGLIYISLAWGLLMNLYGRQVDIRMHDTMYALKANTIPLFLIITIWINDTLAYLVGSWIGKTPLSKISPRKTWEGTMGGALLAVGVAGLAGWQFNFPVIIVMMAAGIIAGAGIFGDLLESKLKRLAGVKDSGSLMPGHGGLLDRFDSMLLAVPALWLFVFFLEQ